MNILERAKALDEKATRLRLASLVDEFQEVYAEYDELAKDIIFTCKQEFNAEVMQAVKIMAKMKDVDWCYDLIRFKTQMFWHMMHSISPFFLFTYLLESGEAKEDDIIILNGTELTMKQARSLSFIFLDEQGRLNRNYFGEGKIMGNETKSECHTNPFDIKI
ncbi:hypothetical protein GR140_18770 [Pseudomonas putida]|uniref:hypothetical protein n=1 Tax=Pseudomonas putida TaxID=303 RepID=UPI001BB09774|nr:hypothetical protein [Pseudomonas putida]QUG90708.1 hypothetical protein GR140_18770 [Pseudomonas putida]